MKPSPFDPESAGKFPKKSRVIKLTLLTGGAVVIVGVAWLGSALDETLTPVDYSSSSPGKTSQKYATEQDCDIQTGNKELCRTAFDDAKKEHVDRAPKFSNLRDCELQYGAGNCATQSVPDQPAVVAAGAPAFGVFLPLMSGFFLSRLIGAGIEKYFSSSFYHNAAGQNFSSDCPKDRCQSSSASSTRGSHTGYHGWGSIFGGSEGSSGAISRGGFGGGFHGGTGG